MWLTLVLHSAFAAFAVTAVSKCDPGHGLIGVQICAVHWAFLLGILPGPSFLVHRRLWWRPSPDDTRVMLLFLIGVLHFLGLGVIEFMALEPTKIHTFTDALYFCFVLLTTVGYGNTISPSTPTSRLFTVAYSAYGLIVFGAGTSIVSGALSVLVAKLKKLMTTTLPHSPEVETPPKVKEEAANIFEPSAAYYTVRDMNRALLAFLIVNFGSAAIYMSTESGWKYADGLYHCFMTATTIGLGDIAPTSQAGRGFAIVHMVGSVVLFGMIIGSILDALDRRALEAQKRKFLQRQLDVELITSLDKDGNGVDRAEFVLGMLVALGTLTEEDYKPFMAQFDELDVNNDHTLSKEDLRAVAGMNQKAQAVEEDKELAGKSTYANRVQEHVVELIVPTGVACMCFVWNNTPGYMLLVVGLLNMRAILIILGSKPNKRAYRVASIIASFSLVILLLAIALFISFIAAKGRTKFALFPIETDYLILGGLDGNGRTKAMFKNATHREHLLDHEAEHMDEEHAEYQPWTTFTFVMFLLILFFMAMVEMKVAVCCCKACGECDKVARDETSRTKKADLSSSTATAEPI